MCAGLNDIRKPEAVRKPFVEAFAFASILKHYDSKKHNMLKAFTSTASELYKINLDIDKNENLLRAQGARYFLMRKNPVLKKMLKNEYKNEKISSLYSDNINEGYCE